MVAFIPSYTADQYIEATIYLIDFSMFLGARIYPFFAGLALLKLIGSTI